MTKSVRIENADMSSYKVNVEVWQKGHEGSPDTLVNTQPLSNPTAMGTFLIHSHQYLIVREAT